MNTSDDIALELSGVPADELRFSKLIEKRISSEPSDCVETFTLTRGPTVESIHGKNPPDQRYLCCTQCLRSASPDTQVSPF